MGESTFIVGKLVILGLVLVAVLGGIAFALYWFLGRREDD